MAIMVFDIETIPDFISARKLYNFPDNLSDSDVIQTLFAKRRQENGTEFLPLHLHKIVAISVVVRKDDWIKVWSLGKEDDAEAEIISRFFHGIDRYTPTLVSWNGAGFDLPVLHYRSLLHGIAARKYWETGDNDNNFKWNNYINRYHNRHSDIMDMLAGFNTRANAPLDEIAQMLGFAGKMGLKGDQVAPKFLNGEIKEIRDYCETDVLNTYLVYLRFQLIQGKIDMTGYNQECELVKSYLEASNQEHFNKFLENWQN